MSITVVDNRSKYDALLRNIAALKGANLTVGIHGDDAGRDDGRSNVMIGAVHEFGAPDHKPPIPQRAFLRPGVASAASDIGSVASEGLRAVIAGSERPRRVLERMGNAALAGIYRRIDSNIGPALSPKTIEKRMRRTAKGRKALNASHRAVRSLIGGAGTAARFVRKGRPFGKGAWVQPKTRTGKANATGRAYGKINALNRMAGGRFTALVDTGQLRKSIAYRVHMMGGAS